MYKKNNREHEPVQRNIKLSCGEGVKIENHQQYMWRASKKLTVNIKIRKTPLLTKLIINVVFRPSTI